MALATKCPHCSTTFRVASDQLKLRGGIVRCGACHEVFDGNAALVVAPVKVPKAPPPAPMPPAFLMRPKPSASETFDTQIAQVEAEVAAVEEQKQAIMALDFDTRFDPYHVLPQTEPAAPEPEPAPIPELDQAPEAEPEAVAEAAPEPQALADAMPEPEPAPEPAPEPEPEADPAPGMELDLELEPAAKEPEPVPAPAPEAPQLKIDFDLNLEPPSEAQIDFDLNLDEIDITDTAPPLAPPAKPKPFLLAEPDFEEPKVAPVETFAEQVVREFASVAHPPAAETPADPVDALAVEPEWDPEPEPEPPARVPASAAMVFVPFELDQQAAVAVAEDFISPDPVDEPEIDPEFSFDSDPATQAAIDTDEQADAAAEAAPPQEVLAEPVLEEHEEPEFVLRSRAREHAARSRRILLVIGSVLLALALVAQGVTTFRNVLAARYPQFLPALASACVHLRCRIELPMQIEALGIETGELQTLGGDNFSLITSLRNQGNLAQAWPHIELTLTDSNDKPLLRRVLAPADYLPKGTASAKGFAARSEQPVKLYFSVSHIKASGYKIAVFYP